MCTAVTFSAQDHYFGRNLDLEKTYLEEILITPRRKVLPLRHESQITGHYAMIGIGAVVEGFPLYYDATNEHGLSMAGLNFPGNARYFPYTVGKINITPFELIPWVLSVCKNLEEAKDLLSNVNLTNTPFSSQLPLSPLHWILAYKNRAITLESTTDGLQIYENPVGILTNNPPFPFHLWNLANYMNLSSREAVNRFAPSLDIPAYSRGMGAMGLPGDLSSASRFVRAAFTKLNSDFCPNEEDALSQFFHILGSVYQQRGCVKLKDGSERTVYSSCCNASKGIYYYTTYENRQITGVHLFHEDLERQNLITYPLLRREQIRWEN